MSTNEGIYILGILPPQGCLSKSLPYHFIPSPFLSLHPSDDAIIYVAVYITTCDILLAFSSSLALLSLPHPRHLIAFPHSPCLNKHTPTTRHRQHRIACLPTTAPAAPSLPPPTQMKTGPRSLIWPSVAASKTASPNATTVRPFPPLQSHPSNTP